MVADGKIAPRFEMRWDVDSLAKAFGVLPEDVREYLTDGRRASFMIERRLQSSNPGWDLAPSEGAGYDLKDPQGGLWEVRSITGGGVYFNPSNQVGSGRSFEQAGFDAKLSMIEGFILTDLVGFPIVDCFQISVTLVRSWAKSGRLGSNARVSRSKFYSRLAPDIK